MTSMKQGAGYSRAGQADGAANIANAGFDMANTATKAKLAEKTPEQKRKESEAKIYKLLDECYEAYGAGNYALALERAKEATKRERLLVKDLEKTSPNSTGNPDLTFCTLFALGNMYQVNQFYNDALNAFNMIVRDKQFYLSGRLRINMGNVYFEQGKYSEAIKMYRMALDQIPATNQIIKSKILKNIGLACLRLGQLTDAMTAFETICEANPSPEILFNLIVCAYGLKNEDKMKKLFQWLTALVVPSMDPSFDGENQLATQAPEDDEAARLHQDELREYAKQVQMELERNIITAARLISPEISGSFHAGFEWTANIVRSSSHSHIGTDIDNAKALHLIKIKELVEATTLLKEFEKRGSERFSAASTNLSALLLAQDDYSQAEKYADLASKTDRFNTKALNNKAACRLKRGDLESSRSTLSDLILIDSLSFEALYNLALTYKLLENYVDALKLFEKLHTLDRQDVEVIYQMAETYDRMDEPQQAIEWINRAIPINPSDPEHLLFLAKLYSKIEDRAQAYHYYSETFRYFPDNIDVLTWLGAYFVENEMYERSVECFSRASIINPVEIKWQLMVASCLRRGGNYQQSLERYKRIHEAYPMNVDCLRLLVRLCSDMGLPEGQTFSEKLVQLEGGMSGTSQLIQPGSVEQKPTAIPQEAAGSMKREDNSAQPSVPISHDIRFDDEDVANILPE